MAEFLLRSQDRISNFKILPASKTSERIEKITVLHRICYFSPKIFCKDDKKKSTNRPSRCLNLKGAVASIYPLTVFRHGLDSHNENMK